ncbi:hypothetical protein [Candidatus Nitrosocosmicus sp. R]
MDEDNSGHTNQWTQPFVQSNTSPVVLCDPCTVKPTFTLSNFSPLNILQCKIEMAINTNLILR